MAQRTDGQNTEHKTPNTKHRQTIYNTHANMFTACEHICLLNEL